MGREPKTNRAIRARKSEGRIRANALVTDGLYANGNGSGAAYVLTGPLGATLGDTRTKSHTEVGLALGRIISSLAIAAAMVVLIALTSRRERVQAA